MLESACHTEHNETVNRILKETGCTDSNGQIRSWKGPIVVPALAEAGHSSVGFNSCTCKSRITKTLNQEWAEFNGTT